MTIGPPISMLHRQISPPFCGGVSLTILAPEPQRHAQNLIYARAAGRYVPIRPRDGTRESDMYTYLTRACLGA